MGSVILRAFAVGILLAGIHSSVVASQKMLESTKAAVFQLELDRIAKRVQTEVRVARAEGNELCNADIRKQVIAEAKTALAAGKRANPNLSRGLLVDRWGAVIDIQVASSMLKLQSAGPDGVAGTADDVVVTASL